MSKDLVFIGDLERYRAEIGTVRNVRYQRLITECERYFSKELPAVHPAESITYMGITIVNLALAYRLTKAERYLDEARRWMKTVCSYEKWGNAHMVNLDLSASWILWGLSLGYDWLADYLPQDEAECVCKKIQNHAKIMHDYFSTHKHGWPVNYCQNHNWINLNGIATAGYVLQKHVGGTEAYIDDALENFKKVFELMPADGSNYEGVTYWRYGGMWLFVYAHLAKVQSGVDFFKTSGYLENTFYYRLYQSAGDKAMQLDFGDCHDRHSCHCAAVYYKTAAEYKNGYAQLFGDLATTDYIVEEAQLSKVKPGILPEAGLEFLFYEPAVEPRAFDDLPLTAYFEDLGLVAMRSSFEQNARVFSFKCGAPGGKVQWDGYHSGKYQDMHMGLSHHHPDNLSYVICEGRNYFTREDNYNRAIMPTHHSTLLVDGKYTDAEGANDVYHTAIDARLAKDPTEDIHGSYFGTCTAPATVGDLIWWKGDNTGIYPKEFQMNEVSRTVITTQNLGFVVFVDTFASELAHKYQVICNTEQPLVLRDGSHGMPMCSARARYLVASETGTAVDQFTQQVSAVMTTQEPDKKNTVDIYTTRTQSTAPQKNQIFVEGLAFGADCAVSNNDGVISITTATETYQILCADDLARLGIAPQGKIAIKTNDDQLTWVG